MVSAIAGSRGSPPRPCTTGAGAASAGAAMASSCAGLRSPGPPPAQAPSAATTSGRRADRAAIKELYACILLGSSFKGCASLQPDLEGGGELREEGTDHRELAGEEQHPDQEHHRPGGALQRE